MTNGIDFNAIAAELVKEYGKDTFSENELTNDFYTDFYFKFQEFLPGNNPREALEAFWLNGGKEWLMTPKGDNYPDAEGTIDPALLRRYYEMRNAITLAQYPETSKILMDAIRDLQQEKLVFEDDIVSELFEADQTEVMHPAIAEYVEGRLLAAMECYNMDAACDLGSLYYTGRIGKQDFARAVELYTMAAEGGQRQAAENLGYCYYYGRSVEKDYEKAFHYFALGAFDGHLISLYKIGDMYRYGLYVARNEKEAFYIYNHCCNTMTEEALPRCGADVFIRMGDCLFEGIGVARDYRAAMYYYQNAERLFYDRLMSGDSMIQKQYEKCIERQSEVRKLLQDMIPEYNWAK